MAESSDSLKSLSYIRTIDLLGEGEFEEVLVGGLRGLYLNEVPIMNEDGSYNFQGIQIETRPGTSWQPPLVYSNTTENTENVGAELRYNVPVEKVINNGDADGAKVSIRLPSLTKQNTDNGNVEGTSVSYKIEWKDSEYPVWNTVIDGTYTTSANVVAGGTRSAAFSGYIVYEYTFSIDTAFDQFSETYYQSSYEIRYRVNEGVWNVLKSDVFAGHSTAYGVISGVSAANKIDLEIVFPPPPLDINDYPMPPQASQLSVIGKHTAPTGVQIISGKSNSEYEKQTYFKLSGPAPWIVKVTRLTPDSTSAFLNNKTFFSSVTTVIEDKLRYPHSVLVAGTYNAEQFNSIPSRAFLCKCLKINVPTNYNPISRVYSGFWDGSFKIAWTDNPAWCFYDLLTNTRYGLGERIPPSLVDKWELYNIGKYCDELVPSSDGTLEPRFTCNVVLQTKEEAYKVISDFATVFRGMTFWGAGAVVPIQDRPQMVSYAFNNSNVVDGMFNYKSSSLASRYNAVYVTWNNPANHYKRDTEYIEDPDLISSSGFVNQTEIAAFGCTSRSMARRVGRWLLYTNNYQTDIVSFTTGVEGVIPRPGDVIKISDTLRSQDRRGGRVVSSTLSSCVLDKEMPFTMGTNYTFSAISETGEIVETTFSGNSTTNTILFSTPLSNSLSKDSVYIIADNNIEPQQFKVISILDKGDNKYEISGLTYNQGKYEFIERGIPLIDTKLPDTTLYPVTSINTNEYLYVDGVSVKNRCDISWSTPKFAGKYLITVATPGGTFYSAETSSPSYSILDAVDGVYSVSITTVNILGLKSSVFISNVHLYGKTAPPKNIVNLSLNAEGASGFLKWDAAKDLDVVVGGVIVITHTPKTVGASWRDGIVVTTVPGSSVSTRVPLQGGTYMVKAIDSSGVYSEVAAFVLADYALVQVKNIIDTLEDSPDFLGSKIDLIREGDSLTLDYSQQIDDVLDVDLVTIFDYLGGGVKTYGEYYFSRSIDVGVPSVVNLSGEVSARNVELFGQFDTRIDLIDTWASFDTLSSDTFSIKLFVSTTNDDPDVSPNWGAWKEFNVSSYSARAFRFKMAVQSVSDLYTVYVDTLKIFADVPDRIVSGNDIQCTTAGLNVTFSPQFMFVPAISINFNDMVEGDYYEISNKTSAGFSVITKNSSLPVERVIDYIAKGYGYKS